MPRNVGGLAIGDIKTIEQNHTARWLNKFCQQIEDCRLTGTIGANHRVNGPATHFDRHIAYGCKSTELLHQSARF